MSTPARGASAGERATYGSDMSTASKASPDRRRSAQIGSYRQSHLGVDKARSYDEDLWDLKAAKGLEWLVEQRLLTGVLQELVAGGSCSSADFACGTGRILEFLSDRFPSVTGIDISPEMLELARSRCPRATLIQGDVTTNHGLAPGPFDLITAFRFFLNAEPVLRSQVLAWMRRSLRQAWCGYREFPSKPGELAWNVSPAANHQAHQANDDVDRASTPAIRGTWLYGPQHPWLQLSPLPSRRAER